MVDIGKRSALRFVILLGLVSLFADITYEGARSITGPYLAILGANATIVGIVAGLGEGMGYGLRLFFGFLADRTRRYWVITIVGYGINLFAVPLLAFAHHWWVASLLIILERTGKAIRTPARDAMLSHAGQQMGMGWGFGLHQALDQTGAVIGPLLVAAVLYWQKNYAFAFGMLIIPAAFALIMLWIARRQYPHPHELEEQFTAIHTEGLHSYIFWLYVAGASCIAFGYADFALIAYHFEKISLLTPAWIPIAYAIAQSVDTLTAPALGHFFDKRGFIILLIATVISGWFAPLVFLGGKLLAILGVMLWGIGIGVQGSLMRAVVAKMIPKNKRASAYGVFNASFGLAWFIGSVLMGMLYDYSILMLVAFSVLAQLAALPFFIITWLKI